MILLSRNADIHWASSGRGRQSSNDSGVVEERAFHRLLLAIIMFGNFTQDIYDTVL